MTPVILVSLPAALALDSLMGDPPWAMHPVRLLGKLAARCETLSRRVLPARAAGIVTWLAVVSATGLLSVAVLYLGSRLGFWGGVLAQALVLWATMAPRDLAVHALRVRTALANGGLEAGRAAVSRIVGRDVERLDREGVLRACVETVAEGLVDGVLSPIFWALIAGPVGAALYRAINTMDSMFGHKNERYLLFGRTAARADDAANWIPARLSIPFTAAAAFVLGLRGRQAMRIGLRDRRLHESPNSAHPEAAFAGALGLRLAGPAWYEGVRHEKPWIGDDMRPIEAEDVRRSVRLMYAATLLFSAAGLAVWGALFILVRNFECARF